MKKSTYTALLMLFCFLGCKNEGKLVADGDKVEQKDPAQIKSSDQAKVDEDSSENPDSITLTEKELHQETSAPAEKIEIADQENEALSQKEDLQDPNKVESTKLKETTRPAVKKAPKVSWVATTHSFGELKEGEKFEHKFKFKNTGNAPLVVKSATPSCGCTIPSYPFIPIEPGEEGFIGIIYNSVGKSGHQTPDIKVVTNALPASYTLTLEGEVLTRE